MADCSCGRSPTGKCVGWHGLSEQQYQEKKSIHDAKQKSKAVAEQIISGRLEDFALPLHWINECFLGADKV